MPDQLILEFRKPGMMTTVQDAKRLGHQSFGVPVGGALDRFSAHWANHLVGNPPDSPVLEITLLGPEIRLRGCGQVAVTGADFSPKINGRPLPMFVTQAVADDDEIVFGKPKNGCRAYLAVGGQWAVRRWLGSASPLLGAGAEVTPDSFIQKNSTLRILAQPAITRRSMPEEQRPVFPPEQRVRVLPGPEFDWFSARSMAYFFGRGHRISPDSNRMGCRLEGLVKDFEPGRELISSGTVPGTVQVTPAGQPIVLLADAQTTGGYPRLANVISADLDKLAQLRPGDELWFSLVGMEEALRAVHSEAIFSRPPP